jgi:hypothetical protein
VRSIFAFPPVCDPNGCVGLVIGNANSLPVSDPLSRNQMELKISTEHPHFKSVRDILSSSTIVLSIALFTFGCGKSPPVSTAPHQLPSASKPSSIALPTEYRILAQHLAMEMKPNPKQFRNELGMAEIMAEGHAARLALNDIKSSDEHINYISAEAKSAVVEIIRRFEKINSLPQPPGAGAVFLKSFLGGVYTGATGDPSGLAGGVSYSSDAQAKSDAIVAEMNSLLAVIDKLEATQLLLPKVAEKYSATFCDSTKLIDVDFDESWGWFGPHDWLCVLNRGPALQNCTIGVQITGMDGAVRNNVHFVQDWPANTRMYARYDLGKDILGKKVSKTTVPCVDRLDLTMYSSNFATLIVHQYKGARRDTDVAARCKDLKFTGRYQAFVPGVFWNTEPGVAFTLSGAALIPQCTVNITFRSSLRSKAWYWELDGWEQDETKTFTPPKGELTFNPTNIDMAISFPNTSYKHVVDLTVGK